MKDKTKVSVIVPTYKRDSRLKKALESLISQTYKNIEIIVISDNADEKWNIKVKEIVENIKERIKECENIEIKLIFNKTNLKSAETRNVGIYSATGNYITFLDDDDYYLENKIKSQVSKMVKDNSDYSITNLKLYTYSGKNTDNRNRKNLLKYIKENKLMNYHIKYHLAGTSTLMYKAEYLKKIGGFDKNEIGDEFILVFKSIKEGGKFSYYDECHVHALIHKGDGGISAGQSKINRANNLYEFKKLHYNYLSKKDIKYVKTRHHATLAYAYIRMKKLSSFLKHSFLSFVISPVNAIKILRYR